MDCLQSTWWTRGGQSGRGNGMPGTRRMAERPGRREREERTPGWRDYLEYRKVITIELPSRLPCFVRIFYAHPRRRFQNTSWWFIKPGIPISTRGSKGCSRLISSNFSYVLSGSLLRRIAIKNRLKILDSEETCSGRLQSQLHKHRSCFGTRNSRSIFWSEGGHGFEREGGTGRGDRRGGWRDPLEYGEIARREV